MDKVSMIGLDLAKSVFEVHGRNAAGEVVLRRTLKRGQMEKFFARQPKAVIGMEACGSAHHWARVLSQLGHDVRLMPPAYVKPYVKRNKSDTIDAAACWEAAGRPDMRFVPIKAAEQQAALSLHRGRDLLVRQQTQLVNALRALLSEFGIVAGTGKAGVEHLVEALRAGTLELPADAVIVATALADQRAALQAAADTLERRITAQVKADAKARMLQSAPGVGPLSAHAMLATLPDPTLFKTGRDFAAWLGLTPRLNGTGGKTRTGSITKQGNPPLRRLLVLGATAWLRQASAHPEKASPWLRGMMARRPKKVVAVAQAARTARILWAMLTHNQPYRAQACA
ncbi:IS110 family transposase [Reyranella sp. CPCC 100927]|uniref:IS110 family transposase n=1 Tax=Reyranella sp. CPCC 100927 TaxID=2599616 RepID=UPI0011B72121|nr:IS110 family transposase [Reyranella sp. CPCC 100927]TWS92597.1 IS110 family transposase [Reyranella sp. CPCC 100927]